MAARLYRGFTSWRYDSAAMDMAFLLRAQRLLEERRPARLDHDMLLASLAARRSAVPQPPAAAPHEGDGEDPLTELLTAGPGWRRAACAQRGCFNRIESQRRINGS